MPAWRPRTSRTRSCRASASCSSGLTGARGVRLGLVTGNFEPVARLKLRQAGIGSFFAGCPGGFGSDSEDRAGLPAIARRRAGDGGRPFPRERTVVIGDTPRDIACARADGLRCIAVATGPHGVAGAGRGRLGGPRRPRGRARSCAASPASAELGSARGRPQADRAPARGGGASRSRGRCSSRRRTSASGCRHGSRSRAQRAGSLGRGRSASCGEREQRQLRVGDRLAAPRCRYPSRSAWRHRARATSAFARIAAARAAKPSSCSASASSSVGREPLELPAHERRHQRGLGREVAVQRADAEAGGPGDIVHLRLRPAGAEHLAGGLEDALPVAARVGAQGSLGPRAAAVRSSESWMVTRFRLTNGIGDSVSLPDEQPEPEVPSR